MTLLVVAALDAEVAHIRDGVDVLVTGVGKARAAAGLAGRLASGPAPSVVVNVGTAGAVDAAVSGVLEAGFVTQHDFPYTAIEALLGRPEPRGFRIGPVGPPVPARTPGDADVIVATGDTFVSDATVAAAVAADGVHLVDMEAFSYAAVCAEFGVPFRCVKAVSDSADGDAGATWLDTVDACARALADWLDRHIRPG